MKNKINPLEQLNNCAYDAITIDKAIKEANKCGEVSINISGLRIVSTADSVLFNKTIDFLESYKKEMVKTIKQVAEEL